MKINFLTITLFLLSLPSYGALSLKDSYQAALLNMESIKRAEAVVKQTKELKNQAVAAVLPSVSGVYSHTKLDPPAAAGQTPFLLTRQYNAGIRLIQPLFRGGLVSALELSQQNILLAKFQRDATAVNLFQLVIGAYFNLCRAQLDEKNVKKLLSFSRERVKEIQERTKIGRSRRGELVEAQAQLEIAESQYQQTLLTLLETGENFEFLTGKKAGEIILPKDIRNLEGPVEEYVKRSRKRPDILAAIQQVEAAGHQVRIAKGGHYPQVDLISNYYLDRSGILESSKWDVGVAVAIPLFQGGAIESEVRRAVQGKRIAELSSAETIRAAERDIKISYQNLIQINIQLKTLKGALARAEEAYGLNKKDYQFGLVTNLDVLQSLNLFIETKRTFDNLVIIGNHQYHNLQALTGALP